MPISLNYEHISQLNTYEGHLGLFSWHLPLAKPKCQAKGKSPDNAGSKGQGPQQIKVEKGWNKGRARDKSISQLLLTILDTSTYSLAKAKLFLKLDQSLAIVWKELPLVFETCNYRFESWF